MILTAVDNLHVWSHAVVCPFVPILLISLTVRSSKFTQVVTHGKISFFFKAKEYSIVYLYYILFIHSSVDEPSDYFILAKL